MDPRLTSAENDAARTLVRRFVDAFDGQVCYLDVWITLYHAVFRTGKVRAHFFRAYATAGRDAV